MNNTIVAPEAFVDFQFKITLHGSQSTTVVNYSKLFRHYLLSRPAFERHISTSYETRDSLYDTPRPVESIVVLYVRVDLSIYKMFFVKNTTKNEVVVF